MMRGKRITSVLRGDDGQPLTVNNAKAASHAFRLEANLRAELQRDAELPTSNGHAATEASIRHTFGAVAAAALRRVKSDPDRANRAAHISRLLRVPLTNPDEVFLRPKATAAEREQARLPIIDPMMDIRDLAANQELLSSIPSQLRCRRVLVFRRSKEGGGCYALPRRPAESAAETSMNGRRGSLQRNSSDRLLSETSVRHHMVTLSGVLRYAYKILKCLPYPVDLEKIRIESRAVTPIPLDTLGKIMENSAPHLRSGIHLTYLLGLRKFEAWHLTTEMVDLPAQKITLSSTMTKNGKATVIPLNADALELVRDLVEKADAGGRIRLLVYDDPRRDPSTGKPRGPRPIENPRNAWRSACRRAGVRYRYHDIKSTFTTMLNRSGASAPLIQALSRHANWSTTLRYLDLDSPERREALDRLPSITKSTSTDPAQE